ncbi:MAG: hypothetical protein H6718_20900 [Polyangiaceae bacterium]|nr:hypothetical protein [Myxococcales bacterium]MCB9587876.1 hypothetical protein [Polyangiaceae bacterium]MCB9608825.1 hypothetical protein [Polyangiaceae bacterium]
MFERRQFGIGLFALFLLSGLGRAIIRQVNVPHQAQYTEPVENFDDIDVRPAPAVRVKRWLGAPPRLDEERPQVLVSLCARWDVCVEEAGFVSALHDRYANRSEVFAVSDEPEDKLHELDARLAKAGMSRTFPLAIDRGEDEGVLDDLATAYGHDFILLPYAWVIHRGQVVWHGDPEDVQGTLDEVLATGDALKSRTAKRDIQQLVADYRKANDDDEVDDLTPQADALRAALIGRAGQALRVAMDLRDVDDDGEFVLELAKLANEGTAARCPATLDGYGLAQWDSGDSEGAIKTQKEVLRLCDALNIECKEGREHWQDYLRLKAEAEAEASDGGSDAAVVGTLDAGTADTGAAGTGATPDSTTADGP